MAKPTHIVVSPMAPFVVLSCIFLKLRFRCRLIYEVKDIWPLSVSEIGGYGKYNPGIIAMHWFARLGYKYADQTVSALPKAFTYMQQHGLIQEKYIHVPNGIDHEEPNEPCHLKPEHLDKIQSADFVVGYAGTLGTTNSLSSLVMAASKLKQHNFLFVLVGQGAEKESLKKLADEHDCKNILFIPPIPKTQVQHMLCHFDAGFIGWNRRYIYRFGIAANKLFDYMLASLPIIHAYSGEGDYVSMASCGISVEAENGNAIAEAVLELASMSYAERSNFGANGRQYVLDNHTYKVIAKKFFEECL